MRATKRAREHRHPLRQVLSSDLQTATRRKDRFENQGLSVINSVNVGPLAPKHVKECPPQPHLNNSMDKLRSNLTATHALN